MSKQFFASLSNIKNNSERKIKDMLTYQSFEVDTIVDTAKTKLTEKKLLENYVKNKICIDEYNEVKLLQDELINQLKADLTITNKTKVLKQIIEEKDSKWYQRIITNLYEANYELLNCVPSKPQPTTTDSLTQVTVSAELTDITGLFSAIESAVSGARDARAQKVKALCDQLESLKLSDFDDLSSGKKSDTTKSDSSSDNSKN